MLYVLRRSRPVSRPYSIPSTRQLGELVFLRRVYACVYDHNVPILDDFLFSWRSLAASASSFLHEAINLRPFSVTVSAYAFCLQRRRFPIPRYANRPDVALNSFGHFFLLPAPSSLYSTLKVSEHDLLCEIILALLQVAPENIELITANNLLNRPWFCT